MEVMVSEYDTLQAFIFIIDSILPPLYHSQKLEGIQIELKVLGDLLKRYVPRVYSHLIALRESSIRENGHEPPLANPYMMQWLLTIFGTFLPKETVFRIWDGLILDGNEILIRAVLSVWKVLESPILETTSADQFYQLMTRMSSGTYDNIVTESELFSTIYSLAPFPMTPLTSFRKKYQDEKPTDLTPISQIKPSRTWSNWLPNFSVGTPRSSSFTVPKIPDIPLEKNCRMENDPPV